MALPKRILAGDVGGTKTVLSLYEANESGWTEVVSTTFASGEHAGLEAPARAFLAGAGGRADVAVIGIAGPVHDNKCHTTNLPWHVDAATLGIALGVPRVQLINDFEAAARGLLELGPDQVVVLQEGDLHPNGIVAVIGAGTGLGEAILVPTERGPKVLPTEGGHATLPSRDEAEDGLVRFLRRRFPEHVSVERAVSGPGLVSIYEYVVESGLASADPAVAERIKAGGGSALISELGLHDKDAACARALAIFISLYGAEAGNLALKTLPRGGLFVAGGIAPKILPALRTGRFLDAFLGKGRMRQVLGEIRVSVVTEPHVALYGARAYAASLIA